MSSKSTNINTTQLITKRQQDLSHQITECYRTLQDVTYLDYPEMFPKLCAQFEDLLYKVGDTLSDENDVAKYDECILTFYELDNDHVYWSKTLMVVLFNLLEYYYPCKIVFYILNFPFEIFFRSSYFIFHSDVEESTKLLKIQIDLYKCMYDILLTYRIGPFDKDTSVGPTQEFIKDRLKRLRVIESQLLDPQ